MRPSAGKGRARAESRDDVRAAGKVMHLQQQSELVYILNLYALPVLISTTTLVIINTAYAVIRQVAHRRSIMNPFSGTKIAVANSIRTSPEDDTQSVGENSMVIGEW